ncbi:MAG: helix-turn-helix domain-containing protein [Microgenomates group bacterium]
MKKILNVKQAAKILGVSTNTMYKYLNQGTITAARGHGQGSFHIPVRSLELFLGSAVPEETLAALEKENTLPEPGSPTPAARNNEVEIPRTPAGLTVKVVRYLLLFGLFLVIIDIATTAQFNFINQFSRIAVFALLILLAYQQGGFVKK